MPTITLPDGAQRIFDKPISVQDIAANIGAGLAKATLAGKVNGKLVDSAFIVEEDANVAILTGSDQEGLDVIRHSTAHLLAQAVKTLFPSAQVTIGPVIENGFYYDFAYERPFTPEDLVAIEEKMHTLAKQDLPVTRQTLSRDAAVQFFKNQGELYKAEIISGIPENEILSLYQQGEFIDLCRGPHVPNTGKLKAFKLLKVAGAYWRGDSKNEMLQRIYGTAWADKKALDDYLYRIEEAEKRDHRKLAKTLDLFHIQEEAQGMVFWHSNGWSIYQEMEQYMRRELRKRNYQEIKTPQILDRSLWEKSGHWEKFSQEMFTTHSESRDYAIKPMSCPAHVQVFNQGLKSYRDLPLRLAEFGCCHRNEFSGALHGLMRVRSMVQDDGHIFCTEEQIPAEVGALIDFLYQVYADFGFSDISIKLSTRPDERLGDDDLWDRAEGALAKALDGRNLNWEIQPGEGAFYGPKIEFSLRDCLGRIWQCGTIQLDYAMPMRLGAHYIAEDGSRQVPVMLHRAILGTFERFMGILLEHYAGVLPVWLAPQQVVAMNITDKHSAFVQKIVEILKNNGFRAKSDLRNEKIGFKIREHTLQRVPFQLVVGDRELETQTVSVRMQNGATLGAMSLEDFIAHLTQQVVNRSRIALEE